MAKNFVEEGKTVAIVASAAISSGDLVQVGDVFAVALTNIPQGETGDGMTEGVFMLPKLKTDDMKTGKKVYLKSGKVQLTNSGSDPLVGVVWADAGTSAGKTQCLIPFPGWQRVWMLSRSERWERQPRLMMSI